MGTAHTQTHHTKLALDLFEWSAIWSSAIAATAVKKQKRRQSVALLSLEAANAICTDHLNKRKKSEGGSSLGVRHKYRHTLTQLLTGKLQKGVSLKEKNTKQRVHYGSDQDCGAGRLQKRTHCSHCANH